MTTITKMTGNFKKWHQFGSHILTVAILQILHLGSQHLMHLIFF